MNQKKDSKHINGLAKKLIHKTYTMTLATAHRDMAWAAPVYYVSDKALFYFFSNPESRHIREALAAGQASAAIYEESSQWRHLRGIQMSGAIKCISPGLEAAAAVKNYILKFPMVQSFFTDLLPIDLSSLYLKFHARLYCFEPHLIYYMDNAIDFGFKQEIHLNEFGS